MKTSHDIRRQNLLSKRKEFKTDKEFADKLAISSAYYYQLKKGVREIGDKARDFEKSLNLPVGWMDRINDSNVSEAQTDLKKVPVISWVQAGEWTEAIDIHAVGYSDEWVNQASGGEYVYALHVRGDSMTAPVGSYPSFPEKTIIHVDPEQKAENGDFVVAKVSGNPEVTFKQLKYNDGKPYLNPLNDDFPKIFEEFRVLGKVIFFGGNL